MIGCRLQELCQMFVVLERLLGQLAAASIDLDQHSARNPV